jgi:metallopeptidase MepB
VFKADPENAGEGRRYRHAVLEKGASWDEMTLLTKFLGRQPNIRAFSEELKIN